MKWVEGAPVKKAQRESDKGEATRSFVKQEKAQANLDKHGSACSLAKEVFGRSHRKAVWRGTRKSGRKKPSFCGNKLT